uniref:ATPase family AAA domain-containing protein 1-like n=1 Tax=Hirondellea gigas TaxID=1518452 RepID=A0A2P2I454_9CRUS
MSVSKLDIISVVARLAIAAAASYISMRMILSALDPTLRQKKQAAEKARVLLQKLGIKEDRTLSEYEQIIASQLVLAENMSTSWRDIAGLQSTIRELRDTVIVPIQARRKHSSQLIRPPKGVLLHGPPGCGKTLLARAVAKEAGCRFINLDVSLLTDKWYGESQKLAGAVFSLATKIQPCIIFIDEVDSFLRVRSSGDHEATAMMKAQFLQQWDGLATDQDALVLVMAATNRPLDVDRAILRRLPASFYIKPPGEREREAILKLILKGESLADDIDLKYIAQHTNSFSGSDLKELCRHAAVYRLRSPDDDLSGSEGEGEEDVYKSAPSSSDDILPPLNMGDLKQAMLKMRSSRVHDISADILSRIDLE